MDVFFKEICCMNVLFRGIYYMSVLLMDICCMSVLF